MATISLKIKTTRRWWVLPLVTCASYIFATVGRYPPPDRFVEWVAVHGSRIEADNE